MDEKENLIHHLSTLLHTEDVRVAEFTMAPGAVGPHHFHSHVTEHCLCLEGVVRIEENDHQDQALHPGERIDIGVSIVHRVSNPGTAPCRYLVIQGVGVYDFQVIDSRQREALDLAKELE